MPRKILVTSALPYANGGIHLGHLVEYIQTDIWVRFQKMQGHTCYYVCADDTHGTPIMLRAEKEGITPENLIDRVWHEHKSDFEGFNIEFDYYGSTNSAETKEHAEAIYQKLQAAGLIEVRSVEQFYDPIKGMFLPDRFIKGECPKCHAKDQYGDNCEACGAIYAPTELIHPYSVVSGAQPERRSSDHYFFKLSDLRCHTFLHNWTQGKLDNQVVAPLQLEAANKMREWFEAGLSNWDISRDAPYFGFEIPGAPGKYFYVWLDAPVGYMGSFSKLCDAKKISFDEYWGIDSTAELYHFIGKDILYFHALFWPAMLNFSGHRTPTQIFAHGFLTVNGEKMSKSRGTFITADSYLQQGLNPEHLRYYYAAKLNGTMEDIDLNLDDFVARVNSDLIGKYINIASRCSGFISQHFSGGLSDLETLAMQGVVLIPNQSTASDAPTIETVDLLNFIRAQSDPIVEAYNARQYSKVIRIVGTMLDYVNFYIDAHKPWAIAKVIEEPGQHQKLHSVCSVSLNAFRLATIYLKPVLPTLARDVEAFLNIAPLQWGDAKNLLLNHTINPYLHLMTRVTQQQINAMKQLNTQTIAPATTGPSVSPKN